MSTEDHLYWRCTYTPRYQALSQIGKSWCRFNSTPIYAARVQPPTPKHLAHSAGAWPDQTVDVLLIDKLAPNSNLAAEDELRLFFCQVIDGVVTIDELPALGRTTPIIERVVGLKGCTVLEIQELTTAAVEILGCILA